MCPRSVRWRACSCTPGGHRPIVVTHDARRRPTLVRLLKEVRGARDLTQWELAAELGYSLHLFQSVESGARSPSLAFARRLAAWLGVPDFLAPLFVQWAGGTPPATIRNDRRDHV
jgi:transcriptional regulator with XRE-family HTH domain